MFFPAKNFHVPSFPQLKRRHFSDTKKTTEIFAFSEPLRCRVPQHLGAFAAVVGFAELPREQLGATARVQDDGTGPARDGMDDGRVPNIDIIYIYNIVIM